MVNISIRCPAIVDYVIGRVLFLLPFAIPHRNTPDEDDSPLNRPRTLAGDKEG
jgi:hypothetical protein